MKSSMWAILGCFLVVGDYTRPVVAFCISSVFEGLTILETNPDINIYKICLTWWRFAKYFYWNEQLRRGQSFTVPDTVSVFRSHVLDTLWPSIDDLRWWGPKLSHSSNEERGSERTMEPGQVRGQVRAISGMQAAPCLLSPSFRCGQGGVEPPTHQSPGSPRNCPAMAAVVIWARPHTWGLGLVCLDPGHHPPTPWCPWHGILYPALGKVKECHYGKD